MRKVNDNISLQGREEIKKAFEFMLDHIGALLVPGNPRFSAVTPQEESSKTIAVGTAYHKLFCLLFTLSRFRKIMKVLRIPGNPQQLDPVDLTKHVAFTYEHVANAVCNVLIINDVTSTAVTYIQQLVRRYGFLDLLDLDHMSHQQMFKSYRQRWKRQADVLQLQRNLLAGAAGNNGSNISIVRPDVTTVMVYDPRQGFGSSLMHPPGPYFIQGEVLIMLSGGMSALLMQPMTLPPPAEPWPPHGSFHSPSLSGLWALLEFRQDYNASATM
uniref:Uncharacterized protein n=2 Tax=Physcomitrium patens TaxID=3218 RepID=A0A2K1JYZ5_PHYPA|nr:hypothetical protein PHYPA_013878 [Physcomitrium patens]